MKTFVTDSVALKLQDIGRSLIFRFVKFETLRF